VRCPPLIAGEALARVGLIQLSDFARFRAGVRATLRAAIIGAAALAIAACTDNDASTGPPPPPPPPPPPADSVAPSIAFHRQPMVRLFPGFAPSLPSVIQIMPRLILDPSPSPPTARHFRDFVTFSRRKQFALRLLICPPGRLLWRRLFATTPETQQAPQLR